MKRIVLFTVFFLFSATIFAQPEIRKKEQVVALPEQKAKTQVPKSDKTTWLGISSNKKYNFLTKQEPRGVDFTGQNARKFAQKTFKLPQNATQGIQPEQQMDLSFLKRDEELGDYKSNGNYLNVYCRDYGEVDGDLVDVYLNDELIIANVYLTGSFQGLNIPLKQGFNKIEFKALNQGLYGPNTAEIKALNDKGKIITQSRWGLLTGYKARLIIVKD